VNELNYITKAIRNQATVFIEKLLDMLSQDIEASAQQYKAIERYREVKSAMGLLQALFVYTASNISQRVLSCCAVVMDAGNMSDQAWQKKFLKCLPWLTYLTNKALPRSDIAEGQPFQHRILKLLDGTHVQQAGKKGAPGAAEKHSESICATI
jgi:hypothetical protein